MELTTSTDLGPDAWLDLLKSSCISMIKKFKPKRFKRKDRDDKDAIQIGYIADDL